MSPFRSRPLSASSKVLAFLLLSSSIGVALRKGEAPVAQGPNASGGCTSVAFNPHHPTAPDEVAGADFTVTTQASPLAWRLNDLVNPSITLTRGQTYTFDLTAVSSVHPFVINSNSSNAAGTIYAGPSFGTTISFTPDFSMPATIYYHCTIHQTSMVGIITLTDPSNFIVTVNPDFTWNINGETNPILTLTRGQSYLFNLIGVGPEHPFVINENEGDADGTIYAGPVTGSVLAFTPDDNTPSTIFYHCQVHFTTMVGTINVSAPSDFLVTANPDLTWNVNGGSNPTLTLVRGRAYSFDLTSVGAIHPFLINSSAVDAGGTVYAGPANGSILYFAPDASTPSTIYYHCLFHSSMVGTITVVDPPDHVIAVNPDLTWNVDGQTNPTLALKRGHTYTFDLSAVSSGHPFVINSNANDAAGTLYAGPSFGTTLSFTPDQSTPSTIYYHCQVHSGTMAGTMVVFDTPDFIVNANPNFTWDIGGQTNPSLVLTRGQTYVFDLTNATTVHPFVVNLNSNNAGGTIYAGPVAGSYLAYTPGFAEPSTIYYHCQVHFATMVGTITLVQPAITVSPRVFLEGPFVQATNLMKDDLRAAGLVPATEPYTALGYAHVGGGGETVAPAVLAVTGNNAIVDWVVVELRDATTPTTVLATRSALLQRDGDVVASDGASPVSFNLAAANYHVAVRHRIHLGIMTQTPVALSTSPASIDFTTAAISTFGANARKTVGTAQVMWMGDTNFNGLVLYTGANNDRDPVLVTVGGTTPNNTVIGYLRTDLNMDGTVKYTGSANDRDPILLNVGSTTPNNSRVQQLP